MSHVCHVSKYDIWPFYSLKIGVDLGVDYFCGSYLKLDCDFVLTKIFMS